MLFLEFSPIALPYEGSQVAYIAELAGALPAMPSSNLLAPAVGFDVPLTGEWNSSRVPSG
jgi:hypothetical protein